LHVLKHTPLASPCFLVEATNKESKRRKMAPKKKPESDPHGMFSGMIVFLVPKGVQARRFQVQYKFQVSPANNEYRCTFFIFHNPLFYSHLNFQSLHLFQFSPLFPVCQIWKERLVRMGAVIEERLCKRVTHVFAMNSDTLLQQLDRDRLSRFKGVGFFFIMPFMSA